MSKTKKETDFWGNEKEVHFNDEGDKIGETRFRETFFGQRVQDHFDADGRKTGETRREETLFSDRAVHYDTDGNRKGYSKDDETFFGDKIQRHFTNDNEQVGATQYDETFFGTRFKSHEGEFFKASKSGKATGAGSYRSTSGGSGSCDGARSDHSAAVNADSGAASWTRWQRLPLIIGIAVAAYFALSPNHVPAPIPSSAPLAQVPVAPLGILSRSLTVSGCSCVAHLVRANGGIDPSATVFVGDYESRGWINWRGKDVLLRTTQPEEWSKQESESRRRLRKYQTGHVHVRVEQAESSAQSCKGRAECEVTDFDFRIAVSDGDVERTATARGQCGC